MKTNYPNKNTCFVLDFESYLICRKITCTLGGVTCETSKNRKKKSSDTRIYIEVGNGKEGKIGLETRVWANFEVGGPVNRPPPCGRCRLHRQHCLPRLACPPRPEEVVKF